MITFPQVTLKEQDNLFVSITSDGSSYTATTAMGSVGGLLISITDSYLSHELKVERTPGGFEASVGDDISYENPSMVAAIGAALLAQVAEDLDEGLVVNGKDVFPMLRYDWEKYLIETL